SNDPLFMQGFPWVLVAPVFLGLQNGFRYALASAMCLLGAAALLWRMGYVEAAASPVNYALSVGVIGLIVGEYRDKWQRTLDATRRQNRERGAVLDQFTRAFHLLKRSHDELEERVAGSGASLHTALDRVAAEIAREPERSLQAAGDSILRLFSHYGAVQMATLHALVADERGALVVAAEPVATLGEPAAIELDHPMVADAVDTGKLTAVHEERAAGRGRCPLACVPLADSGGGLWGMVVVHEMPFLAMNDEQMMLLAALGGRFADWLAGRADAVEDPS
ncbi:MAG: GAF domain-containing protein, partial [Myxococcota bacterium]